MVQRELDRPLGLGHCCSCRQFVRFHPGSVPSVHFSFYNGFCYVSRGVAKAGELPLCSTCTGIIVSHVTAKGGVDPWLGDYL